MNKIRLLITSFISPKFAETIQSRLAAVKLGTGFTQKLIKEKSDCQTRQPQLKIFNQQSSPMLKPGAGQIWIWVRSRDEGSVWLPAVVSLHLSSHFHPLFSSSPQEYTVFITPQVREDVSAVRSWKTDICCENSSSRTDLHSVQAKQLHRLV